jgi:type IV pilus assembly protein PilY1
MILETSPSRARRLSSKLSRSLGSVALACLVLSAARRASAQTDENPPLPNMLLLVDTSGSMEQQANGSNVTCNPATPAGVNHKSRWVTLVEVLTGTIDNYSCQELDRLSTAFSSEYALASGQPPYDSRYPIPYHRPLSGGCAPAPGSPLTGNPFVYPTSNSIGFHYYSNSTSCTFSQAANDGLLDIYDDQVRFGLMTFDTAVNRGTGFTGTMATAGVNTITGRDGLWSYMHDGTVAVGKPRGCTTAAPDQEVGARNAAAPPWEGRMVNFGNPFDGAGAHVIKNRRIQEILLATRPYGATPIAGMLEDAQDFLLRDDSTDPDPIPANASGDAADFGPKDDPFTTCGRATSIILLSDGQPNMDLRPYCEPGVETPAGECPFRRPEEIAEDLFTNSGIKTHVVGFGLADIDHDNNGATATKACSTLTDAECLANTDARACCTLRTIATRGGGIAQFASTGPALRQALSVVIAQNLTASSRTQPVVAGGTGSGSFRFHSGFTPTAVNLWQGRLERVRYTCSKPGFVGVPSEEAFNTSLGDDFVRNVDQAGPANRLLYTYVGGTTMADPVNSNETIRPGIGSTDPDGVGTYRGRVHAGTSAGFVSGLPATALGISSCLNLSGATLTATQCRDQYLRYATGLDGARTSLVGGIYHSTPQVIGRPSAVLRDESYARYALVNATRPTVLYTSSTDGFLHAFKVTSNDPTDASDQTAMVMNDDASNELWAFIPPAVLPNLRHLYPDTNQRLLDGIPAVSEVVAVEPTLATDIPTVFERSPTDAQSGAGTWRAVLVQSFGTARSGYFAVDVTDPVPDSSNPTDLTKGGPRLLWQLTNDAAGAKLFGRGGSTPLITTLFFDPAGGSAVREIPVAVLPGGPGGTKISSGTGCPETPRTFTASNIPATYKPRGKVSCYDFATASEYGARSLTIVRLDTGEIIRTFRQSKTEVASGLQPKVTEVGIDSPIVGRPMAFPAQIGTVAQALYVGDDSGRLWKVDVRAKKPEDWTMRLFADLYPEVIPGDTGHTFDAGEPIDLPVAMSINDVGKPTLNVATGSQELLGAAPAGVRNYVYSFTDEGNATTVNWSKKLTDGTRVLGPMIIFDRNLYFATYTPPSGNACQGTGAVDAIDYVEPLDKDRRWLGGKLVTGYPKSFADITGNSTVTTGVISGISLQQQPSCFSNSLDNFGDDVLGFKGQEVISQVTSGKFEIVVHTGNRASATSQAGAALNTARIELPTPRALSFISGWASIDE